MTLRSPARRLAAVLRPEPAALQLQQATVVALNADGTIDATLRGSSTVVPDITVLGAPPAVDAGVWVLLQRGDPIALGSPGATPRGVLGDVDATANQTGIGTTEADLTGLSAIVDVGTGRRIRATLHVHVHASDVGGVSEVRIRQAGNTAQVSTHRHAASGLTGEHVHILTRTWDDLTGSQTIKGGLRRVGGTGTLDAVASAVAPNLLVVEDLGPA